MATTSNEQPDRNRRSRRRLVVGPIRGLGRAAVKLMRSIVRIPVPAFQQTGASGKDTPGWLRKLRNRSVATVRQSITTTGGLPVRAARQIKGRAGRRGDLADAIRPTAATPEPVDRDQTARSRTKTAVTSIGRTAQRRRKVGERAAPTEQAQVEAKPAKARATARRRGQRRAMSHQAKPTRARRTQELEQHTVQELREQARAAGIKGRSSMTKEQLIKALRDHR